MWQTPIAFSLWAPERLDRSNATQKSLLESFTKRGTLANNNALLCFWELLGVQQPPSKKEEKENAAN